MRYRRRYRRKFRYRTTHFMNYVLIILIIILILLLLRLIFRSFTTPKLPIEEVTSFEIEGSILRELSNSTQKNQTDWIQQVTLLMIENNFEIKNNIEFQQFNFKELQKRYKGRRFDALRQLYTQALGDIEYFPIPEVSYLNMGNKDKANYFYINTWGAKRTYGGERPHLGIDIMDSENMRGRLPVISMTSGTIEKIGWNEKGGWRVGIRSPQGAYFYYAHLDSYAEGISDGVRMKAGQLIGFMGDTGYSKKPGTVGNFPVHLHMGIMLNLSFLDEETWINPYHILEYIEDKKLQWNPQDYDS